MELDDLTSDTTLGVTAVRGWSELPSPREDGSELYPHHGAASSCHPTQHCDSALRMPSLSRSARGTQTSGRVCRAPCKFMLWILGNMKRETGAYTQVPSRDPWMGQKPEHFFLIYGMLIFSLKGNAVSQTNMGLAFSACIWLVNCIFVDLISCLHN